MDIDFSSWLSLLLRWFHLMAGILWIGTSFYFISLQNALKPPTNEADKKAGVGGETWEVHGGGFFHKKKYSVAPDFMPDNLIWYKWEAYLTWLSGILLLCLMYYFKADLYLIDPDKMPLTKIQATFVGVSFIAAGWFIYDGLCQSALGKNNRLFGIVWFLILTAAAWGLDQIFSGRGAYMHVGAMIGSVMAINVFAIIIPNQKKTVASLLAGEKPDPSLGKKAAQRSLHNNYMTLPVLLIMISNHFPMLFGHPHNWIVLAGLSGSAWAIRHFFNRHEAGVLEWRPIVASAVLAMVTILFASIKPAAVTTNTGDVSTAQVRMIIQKHCASCHSDTPTDSTFSAAPKGVMFDKMDEIKKHASRILEQAVEHDTMPLGNITGMTKEERAQLGAGLKAIIETK